MAQLAAALADRYRIERELGAGGMATVYLAHDVKHDRKVALKVLKPELAAVLGAERFVVEIKTTAALQHPHILPLFDSGTAEGFLFYVMPFINGETLRDKLNRERQLGVEEAVRIATEVADALHYAHQQGVIHRDIKPENILLANGRPMVADFGIALAVSAAAGGRMTETGLSLGTPHYMSPEQATAEKEISARSDVYSIASVLYEMLAGEPPHSGGTAQSIIMKIIAEQAPPVTKFRKSVPPHIAAALARALEKVPADRFATAGDFAHALADPAFRTTAIGGGAMAAGTSASPTRSRLMSAAVALVVLASLGAAAAGWMRAPAGAAARVVALTEDIPVSSQSWSLDVAPNGERVTVVGGDQRIYSRLLGTPGVLPLEVEYGFSHRLSPDGTQLAFLTQAFALVVSRLDGGPLRTLATDVGSNSELLWGVDDYIYFENSTRGGLFRVSSGGGEPELLVARDSVSRIWPNVLLPGEQVLLYSKRVAAGATLHALNLKDKTSRELGPAPGVRGLGYSPRGYLLQALGKNLMAQRFDHTSLTFSGEPKVVASVEAGGMRFGYASGTLAFAPALGGGAGTPYIVTAAGERRELTGFPVNGVMRPEVSPDGSRIAVTIASASESTEGDAWIYDIAGRTLTRVTRSGGVQYTAWSRDGEFLYFSENGDVFRIRSDGSTAPEPVLDRTAPSARILITDDGARLLFQESSGAFNIGLYELGRPGSDTLLLRETYREGHMSVSPDGRWLAYYSDESGRTQIYVRRLDDLSRKRQISIEGGTRPRWSSDGRTLFFVSSGELMLQAAALDVGEDIRVREIRSLFQLPNAEFDVFPGDSLFAIAGRVESGNSTAWWRRLTIIHDFDLVLNRLDATDRR